MRILYLDLDTLRPDHLGCYGYHRNTSPNLDRIAADALVCHNYYCSDAPCLPSRTALMSGQFGIHTGAVNHGGTTADIRHEGPGRGFRSRMNQLALPFHLRRAGLRTVSISPFAERHSTFTFYAGFQEMYNTGGGGGESAEDVTPTVLKWIDDNAAGDNWFLHVNYWDAHTPYRAPREFGNPFADDPLPEWITDEVLERHQEKVGPHSVHEINMFNDDINRDQYPRQPGTIHNREQLREMFDGYDCGIAYMDGHIGCVFDALEAKGVLDDLIVIVSSDHAENMGELGIYGEHATADHANCRIPMIVRWPGHTDGGRQDHGLHYGLDLAPTLANMLGTTPCPAWDGQSFAPAITAGEDAGRPYLVLSQCAHVCQRGVRFGPWLYMRTYHDGYHLFPKEMLFNLDDDPHQQCDLAPERPDLCREAAHILLEWHDEMMVTSPYDSDPLWTTIREGGPLHARGYLPRYCERLEATGRGAAIPDLKNRHPGEFR